MDNSSSSVKSLPQPDQEYGNDYMWNPFFDELNWWLSELDQSAILSETNESKLKRNSPSNTNDIIGRKRLADHKYRQKRRDEINKTKAEVDHLRKELSRLTEENETLKMEVLDKIKTLQSQEEFIRQLKQSFHQVKTENLSQSILVRVISEQLCSASDVDLRRENANLKKQIDHLVNLMNNPNKLEIVKLEQDKAESEREMRLLKVIVEALCEKIYHHETHQGQQKLVY